MGTGSMQDIYWETADFNRAYATAPKLCNAQLNCYFMWHHHNKRITKQAKGILPVHLRIYISRSTHVTKFPEQSYGKLRTSNSAKGKGCRRRILIGPGSSCHWDDASGTLNPPHSRQIFGYFHHSDEWCQIQILRHSYISLLKTNRELNIYV